MGKQRDSYWDNLKLVLIFLVVLGHFLLPVSTNGRFVTTVYYWIYLFHIPSFVFVSGVFSKSFVKKKEKAYKLNGFLILYLIFTVLVWIVQFTFKHSFSPRALLSTSGAPWYMLAMFFWYLLIPYISCIRLSISIPLSFFLALLVGLFPECGSFLVLSRTIVFFPFFLLGYHFDRNHIYIIRPWMRVFAAFFLIAVMLVIFFFSQQLSDELKVIYGDSSYSALGYTERFGILIRAFWFLLSSFMTVSLMCLIPGKRFCLTYIGERTLAIYILHRLFRDVFQYLDVYKYLGYDIILLILLFAVSLLTVVIASVKPVSFMLNQCFHLRFFMLPSCQDNT